MILKLILMHGVPEEVIIKEEEERDKSQDKKKQSDFTETSQSQRVKTKSKPFEQVVAAEVTNNRPAKKSQILYC